MSRVAKDPIATIGVDNWATCTDRRLSFVGPLAVRSSLVGHVLFTFKGERPSAEFVCVGGIVAPAQRPVMSRAVASPRLVLATARLGEVKVPYQ